jgi:hypothetical protein
MAVTWMDLNWNGNALEVGRSFAEELVSRHGCGIPREYFLPAAATNAARSVLKVTRIFASARPVVIAVNSPRKIQCAVSFALSKFPPSNFFSAARSIICGARRCGKRFRPPKNPAFVGPVSGPLDFVLAFAGSTREALTWTLP